MYPSKLTNNNQKYKRKCGAPNFFYEAIQINVVTSGFYSLSSLSGIDLYGYLYTMYFNPYNPTERLIFDDDGCCPDYQFKISDSLQPNSTYVLIVTTYKENTRGNFSILASGLDNVIFSPISKSNLSSIISILIAGKNTQFSLIYILINCENHSFSKINSFCIRS